MKMKLFNHFALTILAGVSIFSACGVGGSKGKAESEDANSEFDNAKEQIAVDVSRVMEDLPPPSEVPYLLLQAGVDFNEQVINDITAEKMESYQSNESRAALNLGIYATDIGYLVSYEKSERALDYMGECQKLAAPVGVVDAIDYGIIVRFETNMERKDSLSAIINEVMAKSGERLSELDELNNAALLLAGSWIEGIYISTQIVDTYPTDLPSEAKNLVLSELMKVIIQQKISLNDLVKVMNDVSGSEEVNTTKADLEKIKSIYENELAEIETKIAENAGSFVLETSILSNLTAEVARIRKSIVE